MSVPPPQSGPATLPSGASAKAFLAHAAGSDSATTSLLWLAALSRDLAGRRAHAYRDMDFYADPRQSMANADRVATHLCKELA